MKKLFVSVFVVISMMFAGMFIGVRNTNVSNPVVHMNQGETRQFFQAGVMNGDGSINGTTRCFDNDYYTFCVVNILSNSYSITADYSLDMVFNATSDQIVAAKQAERNPDGTYRFTSRDATMYTYGSGSQNPPPNNPPPQQPSNVQETILNPNSGPVIVQNGDFIVNFRMVKFYQNSCKNISYWPKPDGYNFQIIQITVSGTVCVEDGYVTSYHYRNASLEYIIQKHTGRYQFDTFPSVSNPGSPLPPPAPATTIEANSPKTIPSGSYAVSTTINDVFQVWDKDGWKVLNKEGNNTYVQYNGTKNAVYYPNGGYASITRGGYITDRLPSDAILIKTPTF